MASPALAGLAIGLALTVVHLIGIPLTGTSVNPARSLGPALIVGGQALSQVWLFIVAPARRGRRSPPCCTVTSLPTREPAEAVEPRRQLIGIRPAPLRPGLDPR